MPHLGTSQMAQTRARRINKYLFTQKSFDSKVKEVYYIKNVYYGKNCDTYDYPNIKVSFKSEKRNTTKDKNAKKTDFSIARARERLYRIVEANQQRYKNRKAVFFTLTTRDQIKDYKESNKKIKQFIRRLNKYQGFEAKYIIVPELHKSGAIHYHGIIFNLPFIPIRVFSTRIWKYGSTDLQLPKRIKSISRYIAKYLTKDFHQNTPANTKTYFTSRNLIQPYQELTQEHPKDIVYVKEVSKTPNYIKIKYKLK